MNWRFWETEKMKTARLDREAAVAMTKKKKMWRVNAIEMLKMKDGTWRMGKLDHFVVEAYCPEMAIGVFKYRNAQMSWFVTGVSEATVLG